MNRLINKTVNHRDLGEGIIIKAEEIKGGIAITVEFPTSNEIKRFGFPLALGKILAQDDELQAIADNIAKAKEEAQRKAEAEKKVAEEKDLIEKSKKAVRDTEEKRKKSSIPLETFRDYITKHKANNYSSFDYNGGACQGYMYDLEFDIAKFLKAEILKTTQSSEVVNVLNRIR